MIAAAVVSPLFDDRIGHGNVQTTVGACRHVHPGANIFASRDGTARTRKTAKNRDSEDDQRDKWQQNTHDAIGRGYGRTLKLSDNRTIDRILAEIREHNREPGTNPRRCTRLIRDGPCGGRAG